VEFLVELFFEFLLQLVAEVLLEAGIQVWVDRAGTYREPRPVLAFLGYATLGVALGWLSLVMFPMLFIRSVAWQKVNLVATPVLAGLAMSALGALRRRQGKVVLRIDRFSYGFVFALAMALVRFLGASR
jgi:hypothetical protein